MANINWVDPTQLYRIDELDIGTVFAYNGYVMMKIYIANGKEEQMVVDLEDGTVSRLEPETMVEPLKNKINVWR